MNLRDRLNAIGSTAKKKAEEQPVDVTCLTVRHIHP